VLAPDPENDVMRVKSSGLRGVAMALAGVAVLSLGACAYRQGPVYEESPTHAGQRLPGAQFGVVRGIDNVSGRESTSGAGALIGGVVGAVVGRQFGSGGSARAAGTALGAVGGAVIGNEIEQQQNHTAGRFRVTVQMDDGSQRNFNYAQLGDLRVGDRVRVEGQNLQRF